MGGGDNGQADIIFFNKMSAFHQKFPAGLQQNQCKWKVWKHQETHKTGTYNLKIRYISHLHLLTFFSPVTASRVSPRHCESSLTPSLRVESPPSLWVESHPVTASRVSPRYCESSLPRPSRQNAEILLVRLRYLWRFWFSRTLITYGKNGDGSGFSMKHVSGDFSMKHVGGDFSPNSHEYKKCSFFEFWRVFWSKSFLFESKYFLF